jgi:rhodanese-related sulfurtransferase
VTRPGGIDEVLAATRSRLRRVEPVQAWRAQRDGALLVDIRPVAQRAPTGEIPDALVIERNVLEWRLDPRSEARLPQSDRFDRRIVIVCQEGYASSLAAASLLDLGLCRATDLVGGFAAWCDAGLPVTRAAESSRQPPPRTAAGSRAAAGDTSRIP